MSTPRVMSLCPGMIARIEECWEPHHFREVIKAAKKTFRPLEHLAVVIVRLDLVMVLKPLSEALETLIELREELVEFIDRNPAINNTPTHFSKHEKELRILTGKNEILEGESPNLGIKLLDENKEVIEKSLTVQIFEETKRDKKETARRLGISLGRLVQRLQTYGALNG